MVTGSIYTRILLKELIHQAVKWPLKTTRMVWCLGWSEFLNRMARELTWRLLFIIKWIFLLPLGIYRFFCHGRNPAVKIRLISLSRLILNTSLLVATPLLFILPALRVSRHFCWLPPGRDPGWNILKPRIILTMLLFILVFRPAKKQKEPGASLTGCLRWSLPERREAALILGYGSHGWTVMMICEMRCTKMDFSIFG